ncbi:MAG: succinate dehydrogenase assembly factor 2 [Alphaproteobacteria bacterium]|nr:succinate dehydrogenase assembly factor 2 [Alphaproteobacteria bacterium]
MLDERRKRLRFRAWRRGFREIDLILGGFADARLESLSDSDVAAFEALLEAPDQDVYDWVVGRTPAPISHETPLLGAIRSFQAATGKPDDA